MDFINEGESQTWAMVHVAHFVFLNLKDSPNVSQREREFPFYDLHPGDVAVENNEPGHWKGKVNDQLLKKDLKPLGISRNDKRLQIILKVQDIIHLPHPHQACYYIICITNGFLESLHTPAGP